MELTQERILIVGAGITGLSLGYWFTRHGHNVTLVEAATTGGGKINTIVKDGFELNIGPVTCALTMALEKLILDLGLANQILEPAASSDKRFVYSEGAIHQVEPSIPKLLSNKILSRKGKLALGKDLFLSKKKEAAIGDESIADFVRRHFGEEAHQKLFDPIMGGIYAGDTQQLSIESCLPILKNFAKEYGSVVKGLMKNRKTLKRSRRIISMKGGLGVITKTMEENLKQNIRYGKEVTSVYAEGKTYDVHFADGSRESFSTIYFTVPAYSLANIIKGIDYPLAQMLSDIRYSKVWQVYCSVDKGSAGFNGFGFLVPSHEGKRLLGAVHISSLFPEKSLANKDLFVLFCGGTRLKPYAFDIEQSVAEFSAILKIQEQPQVLHVQEWEKAIPQFNVGFGEIRERIKLFESNHPNLHVAGNYVSGVAVGGCVKLADEIANQLTPA